MYVENLKTGFYELLIGKRVVIFVNYDIDGICAYKILQHLFKYDEILFTMVPVQGLEDLKREYGETPNENVVVLINCGGTIDIVDVLEPQPDVVFFIVDSHRPTDVCNIYSESQVRILRKIEDEETIPDFNDIFRDDEDEEESDASGSDEDGDGPQDRRERREASILKRRERREWAVRRHKIMFDYSQFSYYGRSSSAILFELAWKISKDSLDMLWWAVVGVTEQQLLGKVEDSHFLLEAGTLQSHLLRLSHQQDLSDQGTAIRIAFDKDLQLALYRHWTVEASLFYTRYTACKLKIWSLRGERLLQQLLADMGIPLAQSKQKFNAMDLELRHEFCDKMMKQSEKYELDDITSTCFTLQYGYRQRFSATDVIYSMLALLESCESGKTARMNFMEALDALSRSKRELLESGIERSKELLSQMFQFVRNTINMRLVQSAGPFLFLTIQEGLLNHAQLVKPHCLGMLTRFVLEAYVVSYTTQKNTKPPTMPLIISAPHSEGVRLLLGIPPLKEESPKNFFGKAFEQAAEKSQIEVQSDLFDTSYVLIKMEDQERFFDAMTDFLN